MKKQHHCWQRSKSLQLIFRSKKHRPLLPLGETVLNGSTEQQASVWCHTSQPCPPQSSLSSKRLLRFPCSSPSIESSMMLENSSSFGCRDINVTDTYKAFRVIWTRCMLARDLPIRCLYEARGECCGAPAC